MKRGFFAFFLLPLLVMAAEPGLLLHTSFNKWSTQPDFAKNPKTEPLGIRHELQLRMYEGPKGLGNAVLLNNKEFVGYTPVQNINLKQGTVSFWVKPVNWKTSMDKYFQTFFELRSGDTRYRLIINKNNNQGLVYFTIFNYGRRYSVRCTPNWNMGQWHKIDCTWNSTGMKFYIDGKAPRKGSAQVMDFKSDPKFPEKVPHAQMRLNFVRGWRVNPQWQTAYDDLKIYDRVLSPAEILASYEKVFPSKKIDLKPAAVLPAVLPVISPVKNVSPLNSTVAVQVRNKDLVLDFTVKGSGRKAVWKNRDGELWQDDSVEFHIYDKNNQHRQWIVNPNGAIFDKLGRRVAWQSKAKAAARRTKSGWQARLTIPLADLNVNRSFDAQFCVSDISGKKGGFTWGQMPSNGEYANRKYFGKITLAPGKDFSGVRSIGDPRAGRIDVVCQLAKGVRAASQLTNSSGDLLKTFKAELPAGRTDLLVTLRNKSGKTIYTYPRRFVVNPPLAMNAQINALTKKLECRLDFSASGLKKAAGKVTFMLGKKVCASKSFTSTTPEYSLELPLPEKLKENTHYTVTAQVADFTVSRKLFIPDMTPLKKRVAVDHTVPRPWHKVQRRGYKVFVLDREYDFSAGPLPLQMISRKEKMLSSQPRLLLNGKPFTWGKVKFGKNHGDCQELTAQGKFSGGTVQVKGEVWFDGMYKFTLSLKPEGKLAIKNMRLVWEMPASAARYALTPEYTPWKNDTIRLKWDTREYNSLVWLTGVEKGLAWWCLSDANWIIDPNKENVFITRKKGKVETQVNFFAKPAVLTKTADYTMVFQATPPKRPVNAWREVGSGLRWSKGATDIQVGGHSNTSRITPEHIRGWVSMVPIDSGKFRASMQNLHKKIKGAVTRLYGMPVHISRLDPEYDYFFKSCRNIPAIIWGARAPFTNEPYVVEPCCGHTPIADFHAYNLDKLYRTIPELNGIYFDIMHAHHCENADHGCGGIDAFGRKYSVSGALNLREYTLRVLKIHQKHGNTFGIHAHNAYYPFVHDLGDFWMPGEELYTPILNNPEWGYMEVTSPEAFQCAWNREIRGMDILSMLQFSRIARSQKYPPAKKKIIESAEYCLHGLAPSMLYDYRLMAFGSDMPRYPLFKLWALRKQVKLNQAQFYGYWFKPVTKAVPQVKVSWYKWQKGKGPYPVMLAAVNIKRSAVKTGLVIDWKKTGIAKPARVRDLWSGKVFTGKELASYVLKGHNFMLLVPEK